MNSTSNRTYLDDDVFANFEPDNSPVPQYSILEIIFMYLTEIIKFLICLGSLCASIFLVCIILKFERLKTKTNIFLLHYAIACVIDTLIQPVFGIVAALISDVRRAEVFCLVYNINGSMTLLIFSFGTAIGVYWYLQNFRNEWVVKYVKFQFYFTLVLYSAHSIQMLVFASECFLENVDFTGYYRMCFYWLMVAIIITLYILIRNVTLNQAQLNTKYQLYLSTYIVLSYLPLFFFSLIYDMLPSSANVIYIIIIYLVEYLAYSGPIVIVYLLGEKNKYFKSAYKKVFKRSTRSYNEDDLDEASETENVSNHENSNERTAADGFTPSAFI